MDRAINLERTIKEKFSLSRAKIRAGLAKMDALKIHKIQSSQTDFDEFCACLADLFDGCNLVEEIRDEIAGRGER